MNNDDKDKREYEIAFILKTEEPAGVVGALKQHNFSITRDEPVGKIRLAYPIKKEKQAYFGFIDFVGEPEAVKEFTADLKLIPEVLRFLIITPPIAKKASLAKAGGFVRKSAFPKSTVQPSLLTNEALEKKIEEILQ